MSSASGLGQSPAAPVLASSFLPTSCTGPPGLPGLPSSGSEENIHSGAWALVGQEGPSMDGRGNGMMLRGVWTGVHGGGMDEMWRRGDLKGKVPHGMIQVWTPEKAGLFSSPDTCSSMAFNHDWLVDPRRDPAGERQVSMSPSIPHFLSASLDQASGGVSQAGTVNQPCVAKGLKLCPSDGKSLAHSDTDSKHQSLWGLQSPSGHVWLCHPILTVTSAGSHCILPHLTGEETEAQRDVRVTKRAVGSQETWSAPFPAEPRPSPGVGDSRGSACSSAVISLPTRLVSFPKMLPHFQRGPGRGVFTNP